MSETTRGLQAIIESAGTLHHIEEPPTPCDFASMEDWRAAHDDWYARTNFWRTTFSVTRDGGCCDPHSPEDAEPDGQWETNS